MASYSEQRDSRESIMTTTASRSVLSPLLCSILAGSATTRIVDVVVQQRSWQRAIATLAGCAAARTVYAYLVKKQKGKGVKTKQREQNLASLDAQQQVQPEPVQVIEHSTIEFETAGLAEESPAITVTERCCDYEEEKKEEFDPPNGSPAAIDGNIREGKGAEAGSPAGGEDEARTEEGDEQRKTMTASASIAAATAISALVGESSIARGQMLAQQENEESEKLLYLRKQVAKLKRDTSRMQTDLDFFKESNQRLRDANTTAGQSFAALNQHIQQLSKTNERISSELSGYKQQIQKLSMSQVELRDELKMKQATYGAEVQSRLQYQRLLQSVVDMVQERCRDTRLVEEVLAHADAWEEEQCHSIASGSPIAPKYQQLPPPPPPPHTRSSNGSVMSIRSASLVSP